MAQPGPLLPWVMVTDESFRSGYAYQRFLTEEAARWHAAGMNADYPMGGSDGGTWKVAHDPEGKLPNHEHWNAMRRAERAIGVPETRPAGVRSLGRVP